MSKLEDLVPDLELCMKIPAGKFEDSALVYTFDGRLMHRTIFGGFPAPTLAEIMGALETKTLYYPKVVKLRDFWQVFVNRNVMVDDKLTTSTCLCSGTNPTSAALELWLELNKSNQSDLSDKSDTDRKGGEQ